MALQEYVGNLHLHTPYSDGTLYHQEIAQAAMQAGLDFIIATDHNLYVPEAQGYYHQGEKSLLVLAGEEVHNRRRLPQVNHCLVYNAGEQMCRYAASPQKLIDEVDKRKGLSFLAHPYDAGIPFLRPDSAGIGIPWVDWDISGYTGLEIWNYMADWKQTMVNVRRGLASMARPEDQVIGPRPQTLAKWDELLSAGHKVVGIGNADAHGTWFSAGPFKRCIFPYEFLFRCVNTHILSPVGFSGNVELDGQAIYAALRQGRAFIAYDLIGPARGFKYTAHGLDGKADMGEGLRLRDGVTLQIKAPARGHIKVIFGGEVVAEDRAADTLVHTAQHPGAYRVEVWREFRGRERCWILSNPIYLWGA
jgi:hypothetical protein